MWTSTSGWVAERVDRGSKRGPPKGGVARRMGRYVCRERTADRPPSWNRCRSSGRKELLRSSGAAEVYPLLVCMCAPPHTPHSPPPLPVCHLMLPLQLTHPLDVLVCARVCGEEDTSRGFLLRIKWRLFNVSLKMQCDFHYFTLKLHGI